MLRRRSVQMALFSTITTFVMLLSTAISYAWFLSDFRIADQINDPGDISSNVTTKVWDPDKVGADKWTAFSLASPFTLYLGEMERVDVLPEESDKSYFLFNVTEQNDINAHYQIVVAEIEIEIYSYYEDEVVSVPTVEYYDSLPAQTTFSSYSYMSSNGTLDPTVIFSDKSGMSEFHIETLDYSLTSSFVSPTNYLYINLVPRIVEMQAIIDNIPLNYAPYALSFIFNFVVEMRTIDEY